MTASDDDHQNTQRCRFCLSSFHILLPSLLTPKLKPFNGYGKFHCYLVRASSDVPDFLFDNW
ncbi:hypothetical protein AALP_AA2G146200 [Arabis alpina]|uniref:Uncharacterized protein n=1 Tax=Arabis alpina TaxID=50452 RepID=A0A087HHG6_ARAAL|nr:hypothetical protein AALP_AA2G146200 [Arabis alpina]